MTQPLRAVRVSEHVYWVGAIDWNIRDFHGYLTDQGTTYNAYLVVADKITLIDTVKAPFKDELLARVASVVDPTSIDYIISNHSELDHSGCLPEVIEAVRPEKVFASTMGVKHLDAHFRLGSRVTAVADGQELSLGNMKLSFVETRMLHWPDSMLSYLPEEEVLFSNDAFGMHLASGRRFDDEVSGWEHQAAKYYANILMPLSPLVARALEKVTLLGIKIGTIAPDHGPIWRKDPGRIIQLYSQWASRKLTRKAVVAYDTMWQSTATMARAIGEGLFAGGADPRVMCLKSSHRSDVVTELLDAGALVVGSSTLNNNMLPEMADLLTYVKGLKPKGLIGGAFGSYGWSGESVGQVRESLAAMGVETPEPDVKARFVPDDQALEQCFNLGFALAKRLPQD